MITAKAKPALLLSNTDQSFSKRSHSSVKCCLPDNHSHSTGYIASGYNRAVPQLNAVILLNCSINFLSVIYQYSIIILIGDYYNLSQSAILLLQFIAKI